jgi:hypothetical protein
VTLPLTSPDWHVWHTPARDDYLTGTSHAAASSSTLPKDGPHATDRLLRTMYQNGSKLSHGVLAAPRLAKRNELAGASMADIAREAEITRVNLYCRGETREVILAALRDALAREQRELLLPLFAEQGDAPTRPTRVLEGACATMDAHADLLAGLDDASLDAICHEEGTAPRP